MQVQLIELMRYAAGSKARLEFVQALIKHPAFMFVADSEVEVTQAAELAPLDGLVHNRGLRANAIA
jgi:hypothetical protein